MNIRGRLSARTRINWLIDAGVFLGAVTAAISGIYFLFVPSGGYWGGRNSLFDVRIVFDRSTWNDLHTWGGIVMILAIVLHLLIHWEWIKMMAKRVIKSLWSGSTTMSRGAKVNLLLNILVAISFLITAISGVYFLFAPTGGFQGGRNPGWDQGFIWSRTTWDLIHTWSGIALMVVAVIHFVIHWRWVKNVTVRFFQFDTQPLNNARTLGVS
jgi:hypothetical protein